MQTTQRVVLAGAISTPYVSRTRRAFAVDLERPFARLILDPEVLADREHLLAHRVRRVIGIMIGS